jgi:hypothetical protein
MSNFKIPSRGLNALYEKYRQKYILCYKIVYILDDNETDVVTNLYEENAINLCERLNNVIDKNNRYKYIVKKNII